ANVPSRTSRPSRIQRGIRSVAIDPSIVPMVLGRQRDGAAGDQHEPVAGERRDRLGVELGERPLRRGDEPERGGAPLPEGALERPLLAERLEPAAARGAELGERAALATRDTSEADRG